MIAWPSWLPQSPSIAGYAETPNDRVLRSSIGYGPDNLRRVKAPEISGVTCQMILSGSEANDLLSFFLSDVFQVLPFDWRDHLSADSPLPAATYRFLAAPEISHLSGDNWQATLQLEKL